MILVRLRAPGFSGAIMMAPRPRPLVWLTLACWWLVLAVRAGIQALRW